MKSKMSATALFLLVASSVPAQAASGGAITKKLTINGGGGFTEPTGSAGSRLNTGWNLTGGAGYDFSSRFALLGELSYDRFSINNATLQQLGQPAGNTDVWAFTASPMVRLHPAGKWDVYAIGGAGLYHRTTAFTAPVSTTLTVYDPFFGYYNEVVPVNETLSSKSENKFGFNVGGGFAWNIGSTKAKVYAEVRYHRISSSGGPTTFVPVTFGLRWQ